MEIEYKSKVNIEERSINLDYVKKELNNEIFDFEENTLVKQQYKVVLNYDSVIRREIERDEDDLIGFLDNDVIMERVIVKLEDVKEENTNPKLPNADYLYCNKCRANYDGYCSNCSTLSHILNNSILHLKSKLESNTLPVNVLEIRNISIRKGVFALKRIPKNITFGPFEGASAIEHSNGLLWTIKDNKLVNAENSNWMKYIACTENVSFKNLDIFQCKDSIYFRSIREINEGEELLIYYSVEEIQQLDNEEYCPIPIKGDNFSKIFACTSCCLGFGLDKCLIEHKSKCPYVGNGGNIGDLEIVECHLCKIWLDKQEHLEHHLAYCVENHKVWSNVLNIQETDTNEENAINVNEIILNNQDSDCISNATTASVEIEYQCSVCSYTAKSMLDLTQHQCQNTVQEIESIIYAALKEKLYICQVCFYQTHYKDTLRNHVIHSRKFQCYVCKMQFCNRTPLKLHVKNKHGNGFEKNYECTLCNYQTVVIDYFKRHLKKHEVSYNSEIIGHTLPGKSNTDMHIQSQHESDRQAHYKCRKCTYETIYEIKFLNHVDTHIESKTFGCHICKNKYNEKKNLELHIKIKHEV